MRLEKIKEAVEIQIDEQLNNKTRKREMVYARAVYFKLCKQHTRASLSRIGKSVEKDHATVLHGIKIYNDLIEKYEDLSEYREMYNMLDKIIKRNQLRKYLKTTDLSVYYRNKYKKTLLDLREVRNENRLLKKQIV